MLVILAALAVSVSRLLTPVLNDHLPDFEKWSSQLLEMPVKIGLVHLAWEVYEPVIAFDRVELLDKKTNKPVFYIQSTRVNLSIFRSIFARQPVPELIEVSGVRLTVRQPTAGQFHVEELKTFFL